MKEEKLNKKEYKDILSKNILFIVSDMKKHTEKWNSPTKTVLERKLQGKEITIIKSSYDKERPIQVFIDKIEIDNIKKNEHEILKKEFLIIKNSLNNKNKLLIEKNKRKLNF